MSNHDGSYMLNEILELMEHYEIFEFLGKNRTYCLVRDIIKISEDHDCNPGEILEGAGEKFRICYCCLSFAEKLFEEGVCNDCLKKRGKRIRKSLY